MDKWIDILNTSVDFRVMTIKLGEFLPMLRMPPYSHGSWASAKQDGGRELPPRVFDARRKGPIKGSGDAVALRACHLAEACSLASGPARLIGGTTQLENDGGPALWAGRVKSPKKCNLGSRQRVRIEASATAAFRLVRLTPRRRVQSHFRRHSLSGRPNVGAILGGWDCN